MYLGIKFLILHVVLSLVVQCSTSHHPKTNEPNVFKPGSRVVPGLIKGVYQDIKAWNRRDIRA